MNTPKVVIAQNLKKVSERIDINGNVIDPQTKQVIRKAEEPVKEDNKEE